MVTNFYLGVSTKAFDTKPENPASIVYELTSVTMDDVLRLSTEGHSFCYSFSSSNGYITQHDKRRANFVSTSTIFYDMDKMMVDMNTFIDGLKLKPSIAYTTYSNGLNGRYGYRLIYVLDKPVTTDSDFEIVYNAIANLNCLFQETDNQGKKYGLDRRPVSQQYYGGGKQTETFNSGFIFSISDILSNNINLRNSDNRVDDNFDFPFEGKKEITILSEMESQVLTDFSKLDIQYFVSKYSKAYMQKYILGLSTPLILSEDASYYTFPTEYYEVARKWNYLNGKHTISKWQPGEDRKKKLYCSAKIFIKNIPDISLGALLFCLSKELISYYENFDGKITKTVLYQITKGALNDQTPIDPTKHGQFRVNKKYWKQKGISANAAKQLIKRRLKDEELASLYDDSVPVTELLGKYQAAGIKVGKSTLYQYRKQYRASVHP